MHMTLIQHVPASTRERRPYRNRPPPPIREREREGIERERKRDEVRRGKRSATGIHEDERGWTQGKQHTDPHCTHRYPTDCASQVGEAVSTVEKSPKVSRVPPDMQGTGENQCYGHHVRGTALHKNIYTKGSVGG